MHCASKALSSQKGSGLRAKHFSRSFSPSDTNLEARARRCGGTSSSGRRQSQVVTHLKVPDLALAATLIFLECLFEIENKVGNLAKQYLLPSALTFRHDLQIILVNG